MLNTPMTGAPTDADPVRATRAGETSALGLLHHLTGLSTYRDIAETLQVPIGTVRSRLAAARQRLATALLATADTAHDDVAAITRIRHTEAAESVAAANRGDLTQVLAEYWSPIT